MTQKTHQRTDLKWIYAIGIPTVIGFAAVLISTFYLVGSYIYANYLQLKPAIAEFPLTRSRAELEAKYQELLGKSGFRNDVTVGSISDKVLIETNRKLETSLRSGIKAK